MSNLTKIKGRLPSGIAFSEKGDTCIIGMNQAGTTGNMQNNNAAFEAWALVAKAAGYTSVKLSENECIKEMDMTKSQKLHYYRFLYRVSRFQTGFDDWFTTSSELQKKSTNFENKVLSRDDLFINVPEQDAKSDSESPEARMERRLVQDCKSLNSKLNLDIREYYQQLPVGLFGKSVTNKRAIFPQRCAAIDIWGIDGRIFHLIELKVKKNQNLGILSEVFFYACFIHDMYCQRHLERKDSAYSQKYKKQGGFLRGYHDLIEANIRSVVTHILIEQEHPRLCQALAELNGCKLDGIRFDENVKLLSEFEVKSK